MLDPGSDYVVSEVPPLRVGMRAVRANGYKLIDTPDWRIATAYDDRTERVIESDRIPGNVPSRLDALVKASRKPIDLTVSILAGKFREDSEVLGHFDDN